MSNYAHSNTTANGLYVWTALILCLAPTMLVTQTISDIHIDTPRNFGYTIGDNIRHEMRLTLTGANRLDTTTLPKTGRLNRWLEISRAEAQFENRDKNAVFRIIVEYQIFNAPRQLTSVTIPQLEFLTTGEGNSIPVFIPEWTFTIGPITSPDGIENLNLREDREPQAIPVKGRRIRLLISTLLLSGLLIYIFYERLLLPRLDRDRYPFSKVLAQLRKLQRSDSKSEDYRLGLQAFHEAVNATAGQVVFVRNLDEFLSADSRFAQLRSELESIYARSQDVFFNDASVTESDTALKELVDLCRRCRTLERS